MLRSQLRPTCRRKTSPQDRDLGGCSPAQLLSAFQVLRHPKAIQMCHPPTAFRHRAPPRHPQIPPLYKLGAFPFFPYSQCHRRDCGGAAKKKTTQKWSRYPQKGTIKALSHQPKLQRQLKECSSPMHPPGKRIPLQILPFPTLQRREIQSCTARNTSHLLQLLFKSLLAFPRVLDRSGSFPSHPSPLPDGSSAGTDPAASWSCSSPPLIPKAEKHPLCWDQDQHGGTGAAPIQLRIDRPC